MGCSNGDNEKLGGVEGPLGLFSVGVSHASCPGSHPHPRAIARISRPGRGGRPPLWRGASCWPGCGPGSPVVAIGGQETALF